MNSFYEALACEYLNESIPNEYDIFGGLIGEWDFVNIFDEGKTKIYGEWIFLRVLQGTAIQDLFISPSRKERLRNPLKKGDYSEYGTSIRFFNPNSNTWDIYYGNLGHSVRLEAQKENDKIILTEITEGKIKWIFSEITKESFHWQSTRFENGEWIIKGELFATRRV